MTEIAEEQKERDLTKVALNDPKFLEHVIDLGYNSLMDLRVGIQQEIEKLGQKIVVEEYIREYKIAAGTGASAYTLEFEGPNVGMFWLIDRITSLPEDITVEYYVSSVQTFNLVEKSPVDIIQESPPIYVPPDNKFIAVFSGGPIGVGNDAIVALQARRIRLKRT